MEETNTQLYLKFDLYFCFICLEGEQNLFAAATAHRIGYRHPAGARHLDASDLARRHGAEAGRQARGEGGLTR